MRCTLVGEPAMPQRERSAWMSSRFHCSKSKPRSLSDSARRWASALSCSSEASGCCGFDFADEFGEHAGLFQPHDPLRLRRTRFVGRLDDRHQHRQLGFDDFPAVAHVPADANLVAVDLDELFEIRDLRNAQFFGALRADLGGVAVDRLPSAEDEIEAAHRPHGLAEDVAGGQGIAGGGAAVGDQNRPIGPAVRGSRGARRPLGAVPCVMTVTVPP